MKNTDVIKLLLWVLAFGWFLWLNDPSAEVFIASVQNLLYLKFSILIFINIAFWLLGFFGIILLSQSPNKTRRIAFWVVFFLVYTLNFLYGINCSEILSDINSLKFFNMSSLKSDLTNILYARYFGLVVAMILFSYFTKPLAINMNKYFLISLSLACVLTIILYNNLEVVPMQKFFIFPLLVLYHLILKSIAFVKSSIF